MTGALPSRPFYPTAGELLRRYRDDPLRLVQIFLTALVLGYGARQDNHSPFTVWFLEGLVGVGFTGVEAVIGIIFLLEVIRRLVHHDLWVDRSPVSRPMIWVGIMLGLVPMLRMFLAENGFRIPMELMETPGVFFGFFLWLFVYRREDLQLMLWLVLIAGLFKSIEGIAIFVTVGLGWGLLTGWRDAMLMACMLLGIFFSFAIKPKGEQVYQRVRLFFFLLLPLAMFTYIGSTRRSFVLGAGAAIIVLIFFFEGRERRRLLLMALPLVAGIGLVATLAMGSSQFIDRLGVVGDPSKEGSAAYRLIEVYSISNMIAERPVFGWPMGVPWKNYTLLDFENVSPLVPHNTYLYITWRGGFVGLLVWFWVLAVMLRMHFRTIRAAGTQYERFMAFWLASATIAVIVAGFTMPIGADRLKWFYPFIMVMTSYLPGAWKRPKEALAEPSQMP